LWVNFIETPVLIDDFIPVWSGDNGGTRFASAKSGDIWPCLAEKAFAKLSGGYKHLWGGEIKVAAEFLTGVPSFAISHSDLEPEKLW